MNIEDARNAAKRLLKCKLSEHEVESADATAISVYGTNLDQAADAATTDALTLVDWAIKSLVIEPAQINSAIDDRLIEELGFLPVDGRGVVFSHRLLRGMFSFSPEGEFCWKQQGDLIASFRTADQLSEVIKNRKAIDHAMRNQRGDQGGGANSGMEE